MEEAYGIGERIFDQHALGIASDEVAGAGMPVVGDKDSGFIVAEILDEQLSVGAFAKADLLLEDLGCAIFATGQVERDGAPRRCCQLIDFGQQAFGAPAQRHKGDPGGIQPVEPFVSREFGIEYEVLRHFAMLTLPELDETEDFLGLLTLANVGVRVAEHLTVGVLGEEREDAGLTATAPRQIVGFDHRVFAEIGHGVEIEVDRTPR